MNSAATVGLAGRQRRECFRIAVVGATRRADRYCRRRLGTAGSQCQSTATIYARHPTARSTCGAA